MIMSINLFVLVIARVKKKSIVQVSLFQTNEIIKL